MAWAAIKSNGFPSGYLGPLDSQIFTWNSYLIGGLFFSYPQQNQAIATYVCVHMTQEFFSVVACVKVEQTVALALIWHAMTFIW